ncbi:MAG: GNAT family N-acetyltransferase [Chloroflexota bacterium]
MTHYQKLVGEKCYLSPLSTDDAERIAQWENDLEVTLPLGDEAYLLASREKSHETIVEALRQGWHVFGIVDLATDLLIGRSVLFNINHIDRRAMFGIVIGEKEFWGKGYGQAATRLTLDYAFNLLNLNSVMLGVFAFNRRALQAYRRAGFKEIGRQRQFRILAGQKHDLILMDILAEEFESPVVARHLAAYL